MKIVLRLAIFLLIALLITIGILKLFDQKSLYRATHGFIGIITFMAFFFWLIDSNISQNRLISVNKLIVFFFISLIPCYLGTVFSDLDIKLLGIGSHRNPIFHSGLLFFFLIFLVKRFNILILTTTVVAFGIGLGSHLLWDVLDYADVRWIPGRNLDRLWLGVNGILCFVFAKLSLSFE